MLSVKIKFYFLSFLVSGLLFSAHALDLEALHAKADEGDSEAQFKLGRAYFRGQELKQDYALALKYLQLAAAQKNGAACAGLGVMYANGTGVEKDLKTARSWFEKGSELGDSKAQLNLAILCIKEKDYEKALVLLKKSVAQGNAEAALNLGKLYSQGLGVEKDDHRALAWYQKAAAMGNVDAITGLGLLYQQGIGVEKDLELAMSHYKKAAEKGSGMAMFYLASMHERGLGVEKDSQQALVWYKQAAAADFISAHGFIGSIYLQGKGNVKQDYKEAFQWFSKGSEKGDVLSMYNLGLMYEVGHGIQKDLNQAHLWFHQAAKKEYPRAILKLADMYLEGKHVKADKEFALSLYMKAASKGHSEAMITLARMYREGAGVEKNLELAEKWYLQAVQNDPQFLIPLIDFYLAEGMEAKALPVLKEKAKGGHAEAMARLAYLYTKGTAVTQDYKQAAYWYQLAADKGHLTALIDLSRCYQEGLGVDADLEKARSLLEKAADKGAVKAMTRIGLDYSSKEGLYPLKPDAAYSWLRKASDQAYDKALEAIIILYQKKMCSREEYENALLWYKARHLVNQGNARGLSNIGYFYLYGKGVAQDHAKAFKYLKLAAANNEASGLRLFGICFMEGWGTEKDPETASHFLNKAWKAGDVPAAYFLGQISEQGLAAEIDLQKAFSFYMAAAEKKHQQAILKVAGMYYKGSGVDENHQKAFQWYKKAAEFSPDAMYLLARFYQAGDGVPKNYERALMWFEMAASYNQKRAVTFLKELYIEKKKRRLPVLASMLSHNNPEMRLLAVNLLSKLSEKPFYNQSYKKAEVNKAVSQKMLKLLIDDSAQIRLSTIVALTLLENKSPEFVEGLIARFKDPEEEIQKAACIALGRLCPRSLPALRSILKKPENADELQRAVLSLEYAGTCAAPAMPELFALLTLEQESAILFNALAASARCATEKQLTAQLETWSKLLQHKDPRIRSLSLKVLEKLGASAKPAADAIRSLKDDKVMAVRELAEKILKSF